MLVRELNEEVKQILKAYRCENLVDGTCEARRHAKTLQIYAGDDICMRDCCIGCEDKHVICGYHCCYSDEIEKIIVTGLKGGET